MLKGFREFILRGNVIDLAVAVIIGASFQNVVDSMVKDVITPLIGWVAGEPRFDALVLGPMRVGLFLNTLISFLLVAAVVYFFIVRPINRLMAHFLPKPADPQPMRQCPECLSQIPAAARRCSFCTAVVEPQKAASA